VAPTHALLPWWAGLDGSTNCSPKQRHARSSSSFTHALRWYQHTRFVQAGSGMQSARTLHKHRRPFIDKANKADLDIPILHWAFLLPVVLHLTCADSDTREALQRQNPGVSRLAERHEQQHVPSTASSAGRKWWGGGVGRHEVRTLSEDGAGEGHEVMHNLSCSPLSA